MTEILSSTVEATDIDREIYKLFDLFHDHEGDTYTTTFEVPTLEVPQDYNIGLIVGSSGSGKSSILKQFGEEEELMWNDDYSISAHFGWVDNAIDRLSICW